MGQTPSSILLSSASIAGDCRGLSMKSCFPLFDEWEEKRGSLFKRGLESQKNPADLAPLLKRCRGPLFSFKEGMETLPRALAHELKECLQLGNGAVKLEILPSGIGVHLENGGEDHRRSGHLNTSSLCLRLPPSLLSRNRDGASGIELCHCRDGEYGIRQTRSSPQRIAAYLLPTMSNELILGCVWDSCIFTGSKMKRKSRPASRSCWGEPSS